MNINYTINSLPLNLASFGTKLNIASMQVVEPKSFAISLGLFWYFRCFIALQGITERIFGIASTIALSCFSVIQEVV
jgi:hypothetical protein